MSWQYECVNERVADSQLIIRDSQSNLGQVIKALRISSVYFTYKFSFIGWEKVERIQQKFPVGMRELRSQICKKKQLPRARDRFCLIGHIATASQSGLDSLTQSDRSWTLTYLDNECIDIWQASGYAQSEVQVDRAVRVEESVTNF